MIYKHSSLALYKGTMTLREQTRIITPGSIDDINMCRYPVAPRVLFLTESMKGDVLLSPHLLMKCLEKSPRSSSTIKRHAMPSAIPRKKNPKAQERMTVNPKHRKKARNRNEKSVPAAF